VEWLADARWGETTEVRFDVACIAATLHVTTTTTGVSLDPDGYSVCVDLDPWQDGCAYESAIGVNGGATVPVAPGTHFVELDGVAPNCTASGDNPRTVTANANTEVPFAVTSGAVGSVRVRQAGRTQIGMGMGFVSTTPGVLASGRQELP
jgi:hypothetical protein